MGAGEGGGPRGKYIGERGENEIKKKTDRPNLTKIFFVETVYMYAFLVHLSRAVTASHSL